MSPTFLSTEGRRSCLAAARGFSLIELLVSVVIGLVLTLAITGMLVRSEEGKRTLNSGSAMDQEAAFTSFTLERMLRNAGSGLSQRATDLYGCPLLAKRNGTQVLPAPATLPAPFNALPTAVRLAPVVIFKNAAGASPTGGGDMLQVMTGASGLSEAALQLRGTPTASDKVPLYNTIGMKADDLVMLSAAAGCMVQQVKAGNYDPPTQDLGLAGTYYAASVNGRNVTDYNANSWLLHLGNVKGRPPQFSWIGVGPSRTLQTYDLLQTADITTLPQPPQALSEGVIEMHALYGVDADGDGKVDADGWKKPGEAPWDSATLLNGTTASAKALSQVVAVRVALLLSAPLEDKPVFDASGKEVPPPRPSELKYFSDMGVAYAGTVKWDDLGPVEQRRHHRIVDFTVPIRSVLK